VLYVPRSPFPSRCGYGDQGTSFLPLVAHICGLGGALTALNFRLLVIWRSGGGVNRREVEKSKCWFNLTDADCRGAYLISRIRCNNILIWILLHLILEIRYAVVKIQVHMHDNASSVGL
jgi:hypothetical protein